MKRHLQRHSAVHSMLRRLEQHVTVSPFCRQFYRYIYDCLGGAGLDDEKLDQAFHLFLRLECRKHQAIGRIVHCGTLDLVSVLRFGSHSRELLARLSRAVSRMKPAGSSEAIIRELISVECNYHLGRTEQTVRGLRQAVALGCRHPLVHFALGYNLYRSAIERFTRPAGRKGRLIAHDRPAFEDACCDAIAAFRAGFGDARYDAQLWWWIGLTSEAIGERSDALRAYREAVAADPENFLVPGREKLRQIGEAEDIPPSDEDERLGQMGPITEEEVEEAKRTLARPDALSLLLGEGGP